MKFIDWLLALWKKEEAAQMPMVPSEVSRAYAHWKAGSFANKQYIAEMDYSINSRYPRLFIYDLFNRKLCN